MFYHGLLHVDDPVIADQQNLTYISQERSMIGMDGQRDSETSVLLAQLDDDDV